MALSRERLQSLVDHSTDVVIATDRKGTIHYYNDGASRTLGYRSEEILGAFVGRLYPSVDEAKRVMAAMRDAERDVERLAKEIDTSVECERLDAVRREVARIAEILERFNQMVRDDEVETVQYMGPAKMVDLRRKDRQKADARLAGLRILVVDDDGGICRTLKEILEASGCEVATAGDGAEALIVLQQRAFDLVLSDVVMPNMDGHELYQAVKRDHPSLPILMMTAFHYDKDHIIKRSRMRGLEGVIFKKPVDPAKLREAIAEATGRA